MKSRSVVPADTRGSRRLAVRTRLRWPIPECPVGCDICDSPTARYSIGVGLEAWDKNDTRAVAVFRCEEHVEGQAFPDTILLQRVPLQGLTRTGAQEIYSRLTNFLKDRVRAADIALGATPGRSRERVTKVRSSAFSNRRNGRANSRRRGDVGLESASGDAGVARKGRKSKRASNEAVSQPAQVIDLECEVDNDEIVFVAVSTGFGDLGRAGYEPGDEVGRLSVPLSRLRLLLNQAMKDRQKGVAPERPAVFAGRGASVGDERPL